MKHLNVYPSLLIKITKHTPKVMKGTSNLKSRVNVMFSDTCIKYLATTSLSLVLLILIQIEFDFTDKITHLWYNALKEPNNLVPDVKDNTHKNLI